MLYNSLTVLFLPLAPLFHLKKAIDYWDDVGLGDYGLYFLRDKEKREVDFLVSKDQEPWFLVEVKSSYKEGISKNLGYFQELASKWSKK